VFIVADRTRVKQVVINLLSNAIKYNRSGGQVEVHCTNVGNQMTRVSVSDTGAGLSEIQIGQLFQPFNRLGQEIGLEEGTGIGLVVTRQLVEQMGGKIGVDSVVGQGSVFWVEFGTTVAPVLASDPKPDPASPAATASGLPRPVRSLLYVEDNPANLALVEQLIARRTDLNMISATDGHLGIQLAHACQPALILMDINLPGLSGFGALRLLQGDAGTAHIPVLALSANAMPRDVARGLEAGFFRYLTKPIRVPEFMAALDEALEYAAANEAAAVATNQ
jgi:CheY-like chemotaxis protein